MSKLVSLGYGWWRDERPESLKQVPHPALLRYRHGRGKADVEVIVLLNGDVLIRQLRANVRYTSNKMVELAFVQTLALRQSRAVTAKRRLASSTNDKAWLAELVKLAHAANAQDGLFT